MNTALQSHAFILLMPFFMPKMSFRFSLLGKILLEERAETLLLHKAYLSDLGVTMFFSAVLLLGHFECEPHLGNKREQNKRYERTETW